MVFRWIKRRIANRLRPFVESIVDARIALPQSNSEARPELPRRVPRFLALPDELQRVEIRLETGDTFSLVADRNPGPFEQNVVTSRYLSEIARILMTYLEGKGTLIDLGANIGTVAIPVAATGSRVLAVEMMPRNCLKLLHAVLANGYAGVRLRQAAVSVNDGMLSYTGTEASGSVQQGGAQEAMSLRLDTIVAELDLAEPDFLADPLVLKIDVEGHEYQALLGASRIIAERRPTIMFESIEVDDDTNNTRLCKRYLEGLGYSLFMLRDRILVPKSAEDVQEECVADFLAISRERVESMAQLFVGYDIRQPSQDEQLRWLTDVAKESDDHRRHAVRVIDRLAIDQAGFAAASLDLRASIARQLAGTGEHP